MTYLNFEIFKTGVKLILYWKYFSVHFDCNLCSRCKKKNQIYFVEGSRNCFCVFTIITKLEKPIFCNATGRRVLEVHISPWNEINNIVAGNNRQVVALMNILAWRLQPSRPRTHSIISNEIKFPIYGIKLTKIFISIKLFSEKFSTSSNIRYLCLR